MGLSVDVKASYEFVDTMMFATLQVTCSIASRNLADISEPLGVLIRALVSGADDRKPIGSRINDLLTTGMFFHSILHHIDTLQVSDYAEMVPTTPQLNSRYSTLLI
jgi:hypothetical protein